MMPKSVSYCRRVQRECIDVKNISSPTSFASSDVEAFLPFPAVSNYTSTHTTYLDTTGRPTLTFKYQQLTDKHAGVIYVRVCVTLSLLWRSNGWMTGVVQGFPLSTPKKASGRDDRFRGLIRASSCRETCRSSYSQKSLSYRRR
jgi:hypothetical protein